MGTPSQSKGKASQSLLKSSSSSFDLVADRKERIVLPKSEAGNGLSRFESFIDWVCKNGPKQLGPLHQLVACVLAFDGVVDKVSLEHLLKNISARKLDPDGIHVTWQIDGIINRRVISAQTGICANKVTDWPTNWEEAIDGSIDSIFSVYPVTPSITRKNFRETLFGDAL